MANFGDADLSIFFGDFGEDITYAGITVKGIVDRNDQRESGYGVEMVDRITMVTVPANSFPTALVREAAVTVGGTAMVIREVVQKNDGGITTFATVLP